MKLQLPLSLLLVSFFNLSIFSQSGTFGKISYEKAINLSGKQRMLSQKIAKVVALNVAGAETPTLKAELNSSKTLFERNLQILKSNSSSQSSKIKALLKSEAVEWERFKTLSSAVSLSNFDEFMGSAELLLSKCHNLVVAIESTAKFNNDEGLADPISQLKVETINKAGKQRMVAQKICLYYVACRVYKKGKNADAACLNYKNLFFQMNTLVNDLLVNELNTSDIEVVISGILNTMDKINSRRSEFISNRISLQEMIKLSNSLTSQFNKATNLYSL